MSPHHIPSKPSWVFGHESISEKALLRSVSDGYIRQCRHGANQAEKARPRVDEEVGERSSPAPQPCADCPPEMRPVHRLLSTGESGKQGSPRLQNEGGSTLFLQASSTGQQEEVW